MLVFFKHQFESEIDVELPIIGNAIAILRHDRAVEPFPGALRESQKMIIRDRRIEMRVVIRHVDVMAVIVEQELLVEQRVDINSVNPRGARKKQGDRYDWVPARSNLEAVRGNTSPL